MIPVSLKTVFARFVSAWDQRDRGIGYVLNGGAPTAFGAASLRIDISQCSYVDSLGAPQLQVAGNVTPGGASATLTRADLIYIPQGGGIAVAVGVGVIPSITVPVIPPAIPANATPIAIAYIGPGAVDYTDPTKAYIHDLRPFAIGPSMPNLIPNSDYARRTTRPGDTNSLAMVETFADLNGFIKIDGGAAPTVAANVLTFGAANNNLAWCNGTFVWRDGRISAQFKAVAVNGIYQLWWRIDALNYMYVENNTGNLRLVKVIAGVSTVVNTTANVLTLNRWGWLELEKQGTTFIAKYYDAGPAPITKATSTLLATLTTPVADASVQLGATVSITSDQATAAWGGLAGSPGGLYVETWLPESWGTFGFGGTLGGQAIGINELADSGPIGKQIALRMFQPNQARNFDFGATGPIGSVSPLTPYATSWYYRLVGMVGAGVATTLRLGLADVVGTEQQTVDVTINQASSAAWTRGVGLLPGHANARKPFARVVGFTTGAWTNAVVEIMCAQLEQGPTATAWRPAPADNGPVVWRLLASGLTNATTTSAALVEVDPRNLSGNLDFPWDANVEILFSGAMSESVAGNVMYAAVLIDGVQAPGMACHAPVAGYLTNMSYTTRVQVAAGRHRVAAGFAASAGIVTADLADNMQVTVIATRGK